MEMNEMEWQSAESTTQGPSVDFIRAVAELLETDPDDILSEMGYRAEQAEVAASSF